MLMMSFIVFCAASGPFDENQLLKLNLPLKIRLFKLTSDTLICIIARIAHFYHVHTSCTCHVPVLQFSVKSHTFPVKLYILMLIWQHFPYVEYHILHLESFLLSNRQLSHLPFTSNLIETGLQF